MVKLFFWSPHIDPQIATVKSVYNSINSLSKHEKKVKITLLNVFGEWDKFSFNNIDVIKLIIRRQIIKKKFKGFINSRVLYFRILLQSYFPLKKIIKNENPNYLIIHLLTIIPIILFIFNNFQTKLILRISGLPKLNIFRYFIWKIASRKIYYIICPTEETKNLLIKKNIFNPNKIICIQDPIFNIKRINIEKKKPLEEKYEKSYFLSVGRFTKQKNHQFLLNFFSKNRKYLKDISLLVIGNGEYEKKYKKFIKKNNLETEIKILNYKKNVINYIHNAKLIISCSLWEDPGFIMVEAASVGTPILTSNCPSGPKEFIGNSENGFIFDTNNEESFKIALDNFLRSSKKDLNYKLICAKKKSKQYTGIYNANKIYNLLKI
ncbi:glycosyltransferase [Candidatus Pelagibacter sp.]|nr:glycosyltransferase [Candidatus Pelagibacter sp.]